MRRFILTTRRFINLGDDKFMDNLMSLFGSKMKRAVDLESITAITYSEYSNEFILHIPTEYDYRLRASEQYRNLVLLNPKAVTTSFTTCLS